MKQFYELYAGHENVSPVVTHLSWTKIVKESRITYTGRRLYKIVI